LVSNFKKVSNAIYNNINILFSLKDKEVEKFYSKLQTESIEKSLMEKSKNVLLSPISFSWVDLGTYNSLCNILKSDNTNVIKGKNIYELENKNTFIHNTTNIKVGVIGLENVAVVLTNGGLLVLNKDKENLVSEISKRMK
jgi:mannose-1-phosphate guanylyltransferase